MHDLHLNCVIPSELQDLLLHHQVISMRHLNLAGGSWGAIDTTGMHKIGTQLTFNKIGTQLT